MPEPDRPRPRGPLPRAACLARRALVFALAVAAGGCGGAGGSGHGRYCAFEPDPANPLLSPPFPDFILGDPSVLDPGESPDGRWHLFANTIFQGIFHHVSDDGVAWERADRLFGLGAVRPYVLATGEGYALYYEQYLGYSRSRLEVVTSPDLLTWSAPSVALEPEQGFEVEGQRRVGNAFVAEEDGTWRLYYSGGGVLLEDSNVFEPVGLGSATAPGPLGPWRREHRLELPVPAGSRETLGWGSIKVLPGGAGGRRAAFANLLFREGELTGSAIYFLRSGDGRRWTNACPGAAIDPSGAGWDAAYVYGFDPVPATAANGEDRLLLYANARDGHRGGVERVGRYRSVAP